MFAEIKRKSDICFVIDSSTAMVAHDPLNWNRVITFVKEVIARFKISRDGVRIAVVIFSSSGYVKLKLNEEYTVGGVLRRIDTLPHLGGSRNLAAGLKQMNEVVFRTENGDRPGAANFVIVITCGTSTVTSGQSELYAKKAKDKGVKIIAIGITKFDRGELFKIASPPLKETLFYVINFPKLGTLLPKVVKETSHPTVSYPSEPTFPSLIY